MHRLATHWILIVAFAIAIGHLTWRVLGPPSPPDYRVGGTVTAMTGFDPEMKHLYLRRQFHLSAQPRLAWILVVGHDGITVYVNGKTVSQTSHRHYNKAHLIDLVPQLRIGANVIAIHAEQNVHGRPPRVGVEGLYVLADQFHSLSTDDKWRGFQRFDRDARYWFEPEYDDRHWDKPIIAAARLTGATQIPPRAITTLPTGQWITPAEHSNGVAVLRREFTVGSSPRHAWLRLTALGMYRLAINDIVLDVQEKQLGTSEPVRPVQRLYDITPVVRRGTNTVAVLMEATRGSPHLLVDLEVETHSGDHFRVASDKDWVTSAGLAGGGFTSHPTDPARWRPCFVESGDLGVAPWHVRRAPTSVNLPLHTLLRRAAIKAGLIVSIALLTFVGCRFVSARLRRIQGCSALGRGHRSIELALLPATVLIGAAVLSIYDPRVGPQDVYRGIWLLLAVLSVPLQWVWLAAAARRHASQTTSKDEDHHSRVPSSAVNWVVAGLVVAGFWIRFGETLREPLNPDEVSAYLVTEGFVERGFPSLVVHEDLPPLYVATSELVHLSMSVSALFFDNPRYVIRIPCVCWATLTIVLIFVTGRRLFGTTVGLIAAVLYVFAPTCREMANFGRYFTTLEFFTLLTIYFFHRTIEGTGPIHRRALWLTTFSFIGMFLSWEGSALVAFGMIAAVLWQRRGYLRGVLTERSVWAAMVVVATVVGVQSAYRTLQQTSRLWYGGGAEDVAFTFMTRYPDFRPLFYFSESSWSYDAFIPIVGLFGAGLLAIRHPYRRSIRFLGLILVSTCFIETLCLPVRATRYVYHLTPVTILLASAAIQACARWLTSLRRPAILPRPWTRYASGLGVAVAIVPVLLGSGMTIQLPEMEGFHAKGSEFGTMRNADHMAAVNYLAEHCREGDVVLSTVPHHIDSLLGRRTEYWLETKLHLQAVLDDVRPLPLHRIAGTAMISNIEDLQSVFARHQRVWFLPSPTFHSRLNRAKATAFIRQHMDVVYQDHESVLFVRGLNHRSAALRNKDEARIGKTSAGLLP